MGIGPAPAIRAVLDAGGLRLDQIDRVEINEAFGAQPSPVSASSASTRTSSTSTAAPSHSAIRSAQPAFASSLTLARELRRSHTRWGIASACIGGGQGIALLIENEDYQ